MSDPDRANRNPLIADLKRRATNIREHALRMAAVQGQGYVGQALGIADVLAVAYFAALNYRAEDPDWEGRDRFLLSIGHYAIALYAALLEAGVRVFEWDGPMLHAKTAVADGRWARIGSTNLNLASWAGNWELDIAVEDEDFAGQMERMFERDLEHATEIVLDRKRVLAAEPRTGTPRRGSPGRIAAGAAGLGSTVGAAITNHRALGPAEAKVMAVGGVLLLALSLLAIVYPLVVTFPLAALGCWVAATLLIRAIRLRSGTSQPPTAGDPPDVDKRSSSRRLPPDPAASTVGTNDQDRQLEPPAPDRGHA